MNERHVFLVCLHVFVDDGGIITVTQREEDGRVCKIQAAGLLTENCCVAWLLGSHKGHVNQIASDQGRTARAPRLSETLSLLPVSSSFPSVSLSPVAVSLHISAKKTEGASPQRLSLPFPLKEKETQRCAKADRKTELILA